MADLRNRASRYVGNAGEVVIPAVDTQWDGLADVLFVARSSLAQLRENRASGSWSPACTGAQNAMNALLQAVCMVCAELRARREKERGDKRTEGAQRPHAFPAAPLMLAWLATVTEGLGLSTHRVNDFGDMRDESLQEARGRVSGYRREAIALQFERAAHGAPDEDSE